MMTNNILVIAEKAPQYDGGNGTQKLLYTSYVNMPEVNFLIINDEKKKVSLDNWTRFFSLESDGIVNKKKWRYSDFIDSFSSKQERFEISEKYVFQLTDLIDKIIKERKIDFVVFEQSGMLMWSWYKALPPNVKGVLRIHDSHYLYFLSDLKLRKNIMSKIALMGFAFAQKHYEKANISNWDQVQFVSTKESEFYKSRFPKEKTKIIFTPTSIMYGKNEYLHNLKKTIDILFVGTMTWKPNTDAVYWFLKEVLPLIRRALPGVSVRIVGKDADTKISYQGKDVEIFGFVDSLEEIYKTTYLAINPSQSGGGVKVKLMEYAAFGIPIVTTSNGIAGFTEDIKKALFVCDDAESFSRAVMDLLQGDQLRIEYSKKIFNYTKQNFDKNKNQKIWLKEIEKLK